MPQCAFPIPDPDDLQLRPMTDEEHRGFRFACQSLALWAAQIERNAKNLGGSGETVPLETMMIRGAQMTRGLADALERSTCLTPRGVSTG